jgi:hypothetical protein
VSTPFNNQWVLGRARSRRRPRPSGPREAAAQVPGGAHATQEAQAGTLPPNPRHGAHADARLDLAFMARAARKRPRWIDRDT